MASALGRKAALALHLLLASLVPLPSTCQDYGDDNVTEVSPEVSSASPAGSPASLEPTTPGGDEAPVTKVTSVTEFKPDEPDIAPDEPKGPGATEQSRPPPRVTTPLPPFKPATIGNRGPVYEGTFRQCSSHKDCLPDECCIYGLSRGDSCVRHSKPCPIVEVPVRPQPRFCPPYNSGGYFLNACSKPEDCPYPYLCCRLRGSFLCVPSFYDRRRRRRRRRRQAAVGHYGDFHTTSKWLGLG
ncbi:uncharacterized protein LOC144107051 [Amblyomma americanum]